MRRDRLVRLGLGLVATVGLAVGAVACGGGGGGSAPDVSLNEQQAAGAKLARSNGCAGCHGVNFTGASGPGWAGLAGSEVTLNDGTTVIADDAYLTRAITDPGAQTVDGYSIRMPTNNLSDAEVADIVAYIRALAGG